VLQLTTKAMSGDTKATQQIMHWNRVYEELAEQQPADSADGERNEAVARGLLKRMQALRSAETPSAAQTTEEQTP